MIKKLKKSLKEDSSLFTPPYQKVTSSLGGDTFDNANFIPFLGLEFVKSRVNVQNDVEIFQGHGICCKYRGFQAYVGEGFIKSLLLSMIMVIGSMIYAYSAPNKKPTVPITAPARVTNDSLSKDIAKVTELVEEQKTFLQEREKRELIIFILKSVMLSIVIILGLITLLRRNNKGNPPPPSGGGTSPGDTVSNIFRDISNLPL